MFVEPNVCACVCACDVVTHKKSFVDMFLFQLCCTFSRSMHVLAQSLPQNVIPGLKADLLKSNHDDKHSMCCVNEPLCHLCFKMNRA